MPSSFSRVTVTAASILLMAAAASNAADAASLIARGNEPGWSIEISDTNIVFQGQDGKSFTIEPLPRRTTANGVDTYSATVEGHPFTLSIADRLCSDTMSGMPFPKTATLVFGNRTLKGCAGEPASLLHGDWQVKEIDGKAVVAKSDPSLSFDRDGSVHGNGSCNRFFGHFTLTGEGLSISPTGTSRMMCDQPLMDQERSLLRAFESVHRFEAASQNEIRLFGNGQRPLLVIQR